MVLQDHVSLKWNLKGVIVEGRVSEDGTIRSYVVKKENGRETIRSSRHIKFATKRSERKIRFSDSENETIETDDELANNLVDTTYENEALGRLEQAAERESLGLAQRAEDVLRKEQEQNIG